MPDVIDARLEDEAAQADQDRRKAALAAYIEHHGLPPMVDGPKLEQFDALELAHAIDHELGRAVVMGWKKLELRMDLRDAFLLAAHLRGNP